MKRPKSSRYIPPPVDPDEEDGLDGEDDEPPPDPTTDKK